MMLIIFTLINNLFLSMLETILQDFTLAYLFPFDNTKLIKKTELRK